MTEDRKKKILIVEDEPHLAFNLEINLREEGYDIITAVDGAIALEKYNNDGPFDLIILDIMLPEIDGFEVAKRIRDKDDKTSILILTARASDIDKIRGLKLGVDDYITKPFHLQELLLRINRNLKRIDLIKKEFIEQNPLPEMTITAGNYSLDLNALKLSTSDNTYDLTALEADVFAEFMKNPEKVLTREYLLKKVWKVSANQETRTVDNFIMRLRKLIEKDPSHPIVLESIRGRGYKLNIYK